MKYTAISLVTVLGLIMSNTIVYAQNSPCKSHVNPIPTNNSRSISNIVFTFNNLHSYNNCLDFILLAYERRTKYLKVLEQQGKINSSCIEQIFTIFGTNLDRDLVLELIELADFRARSLLSRELYPGYGIRRRIAFKLGYLYKIDLKDPKMCSLAKNSSTEK